MQSLSRAMEEPMSITTMMDMEWWMRAMSVAALPQAQTSMLLWRPRSKHKQYRMEPRVQVFPVLELQVWEFLASNLVANLRIIRLADLGSTWLRLRIRTQQTFKMTFWPNMMNSVSHGDRRLLKCGNFDNKILAISINQSCFFRV